MSGSAITPIGSAANLVAEPPSAVINQVTTANSDGTVTIVTTYANGTTETTTQAAPASGLVTKQITTANADGTITVVTSYADGKTTTTTETNPNPTTTDVLDPHNAAQLNVLLAVQEKAKPV
jgi:hypothetical protein